MLKKCLNCGKEFNGRENRKFCSRVCADSFKRGKQISPRIIKKCEWCGAEFTILKSQNDNPKKCKRFCSPSCSAFWRNATYGANTAGESARQRSREALKNKWGDEEFRKKKIEFMREHNPSKDPEVMKKIVKTMRERGHYVNRFKYGNGKVSEYERKVYKDLTDNGFLYNYAIPTGYARCAFPLKRYAKNYKPDFVNLVKKICIEIDGKSHESEQVKQLDRKKEECLTFLGFKIIRFTHEQIDKGEFKSWLNSYLKDC